MAISLEEPTQGTGSPVLQRKTIGEQFVGGILKFEMRDDLDDKGERQIKDNGKAKQEMVVHLLVLESSMQAGIGGEYSVPNRGDVVRAIFSKGEFGQWIDAKDEYAQTVNVGTMMYRDTTHYDKFSTTGGFKLIGRVDTNEDLAALRQSAEWTDRKVNAGGRGDLKLRAPKPEESGFVEECEAAYHKLTAIALEDDGPFDNQAPAPAAASGNIPF